MLDAAVALAHHCEQRWSRFIDTSDVTRLNWAEGESVEVDPITVRLMEAMLDGVALTGGDYDPTLLPDVLTAGYAVSTVDPSRVTTLPASVRSPGNIAAVAITGTTLTLPIGTSIDPGGIGKGLTADLVCEFAMAQGAWGVLAEIGGDIVVAGDPPAETAWRLGIENPFDASAHSAIVRLSRGALATSSQRKRRFTTAAGIRHHLVNPHTNESAVTTVQTVSVIAATGARAEALTKSGFVRDTNDYLEWLPTVGAAGLVINEDGAERASENWERYL
jgi:thiamine biosynthesis lipoprotein